MATFQAFFKQMWKQKRVYLIGLCCAPSETAMKVSNLAHLFKH
jgi:hypothetical protein